MARREGPREHTRRPEGTSEAQWLRCFPDVLRCHQRTTRLSSVGTQGAVHRLFGINTSVACFLQQANISLGMSAICRKDYPVGKEGGVILKVTAHPFGKKQQCILNTGLPPLTCLLSAPGSRWPQREGHAGPCFCGRRLARRGGGRGGQLLWEGSRVGRDPEQRVYTAQLPVLL